MAESLARGVGASAAAVYLGPPGSDRLRGAWPDPGSLPARPPSCTAAVRHRGERLGSLSLWTEEARQLNSTERALLDGLAAQAALVLRNERLTAELEHRLEELRASRRRLASAQDAERRRLERDLHDGAQHDLVAIRMKLGLAEAEASVIDNDRLAGLLSGLKEETGAALENIRGLVRGLHPPLLESQGLASALAAHARRLPLPVLVSASSERFDGEVEAAVYYCCIEALHNVVKHSGASSARVTIDCIDGRLKVEVRDDGRGFDVAAAHGGSGLQNTSDRMDALGGRVTVASTSAGTSVTCELEAEPRRRDQLLRRAGAEGGC
jgi:signal transduction histidine kinase